MEFNKSLIKTATPVYSFVNIEDTPINPYREIVHYAAYTVFPTLGKYNNLSLRDFSKLSSDAQRAILEEAESFGENIKITYAKVTTHPRVFLEASYVQNNNTLCTLKFYSYTKYEAKNTDDNSINYDVEIDFSMNPLLDFMKISKYDNFFDFSKNDLNPFCVDMILAFLKVFANPADFLKIHKAKSITINNIRLFANKLIQPYVTDMTIIYIPEHFLVGAVCGTDIIKETYSYDNYLESVKQFANNIRAKYGDKYKKDTSKKDE